jgi:hypothetical protein
MKAQAEEIRRRKEAAIKAQQKQFEEDLREAAKREAELRKINEQHKKEWAEALKGSGMHRSSTPRRETFNPRETETPEPEVQAPRRPKPSFEQT